MYVIGLIGGAASGKSTVLRHLATLGAEVLDADQVAKELSVPGGKLYQAIVDAFGREYVRADGELDRAKLRGRVFSEEKALTRLNAISQKILCNELRKRISASKKEILVLEAIRLYEAGLEEYCDEVWQVVCDHGVQVERLIQRDGITREQAEAMLAKQERLLCGPYTLRVDNSGDFRYTVSNVEHALNEIREKIRDGKGKQG